MNEWPFNSKDTISVSLFAYSAPAIAFDTAKNVASTF